MRLAAFRDFVPHTTSITSIPHIIPIRHSHSRIHHSHHRPSQGHCHCNCQQEKQKEKERERKRRTAATDGTVELDGVEDEGLGVLGGGVEVVGPVVSQDHHASLLPTRQSSGDCDDFEMKRRKETEERGKETDLLGSTAEEDGLQLDVSAAGDRGLDGGGGLHPIPFIIVVVHWSHRPFGDVVSVLTPTQCDR